MPTPGNNEKLLVLLDNPLQLTKAKLKSALDSGADINVGSTRMLGATALYTTALMGNKGCVTMLVKRKADVHTCVDNLESPLHAAAQNGKEKCVQILLNAKANVDAMTDCGSTPLHLAAVKGSLDCTAVLLSAGAAVDVQDEDGETPLFSAALLGQTTVVKLLLEKKANPLAVRTADNRSPLAAALLSERKGCIALLRPLSGEHCFVCGATTNLTKCARCVRQTYCGRECQVKDWKQGHKRACVPVNSAVK
jgi:ankyrin repeat protein